MIKFKTKFLRCNLWLNYSEVLGIVCLCVEPEGANELDGALLYDGLVVVALPEVFPEFRR